MRDVTGGSKLPFKIKPGAPDDSLFVAADGDVGIGTDSPSVRMHVTGGNMRIERSDATTTSLRMVNTTQSWQLQSNGSSGDFEIRDVTNTSTPFTIEDGAPSGFFKITASGTVVINSLVTGSNAGSSVCVDANGALCACGSCA